MNNALVATLKNTQLDSILHQRFTTRSASW